MKENPKGLTFRILSLLAVCVLLSSCSQEITESNEPVTGTNPAGLDARPSNASCLAPPRPTSGASVAATEAFPNLPPFNLPVKILVEPGPTPRWFALEKAGLVRVFDPVAATSIATYIDLTGDVSLYNDGGLLGMDFHPDYPDTQELFLSYTRGHTFPNMRSVISRFILDNVTTPVSVTEQVILEVDQSFDFHFGGDIAFGPDRYLYFGLGDGGPQEDANNHAQDTRLLLGSMLRIDVLDPSVSHPDNPYVIPTDNPFATNSKCGPALNANACPEIFAWGFRNPWRWNFDQPTGALWLGDVGQSDWEEVDLVERSGNYGWRCREGAHDFNPTGCPAGLTDPVAEYRNDGINASITGGYVYRGTAIPGLVGRYVFGDFISGRIWALQSDGQGGFINDELIDTPFGISTFGIDQFGELHFADFSSGRIYTIVPSGPGNPDTIATVLSDTGCARPTDGLIPYDINAPFWSDAAVKERFFAVPDGTVITINADDDWVLPPGSVIVKNFRLNGKLIETRLLMRHPDGVWAGYPYEWDATETEAIRVEGGKTVLIDGQSYIFPSEGECMSCHTSVAGFSLGLETAQLNRNFMYPTTGRTANQLTTLDHIMMFSTPLPGMPPADFPQLTDPADTTANLDNRARAYMHTNCAQCHRGLSSPTPSDMDFRYTTSLSNTNACDAIPRNGDLGISNPRIIAPGDVSHSVLIERMSRRDSTGMPPLASNLPDLTGVALITDWVNGLANCN